MLTFSWQKQPKYKYKKKKNENKKSHLWEFRQQTRPWKKKNNKKTPSRVSWKVGGLTNARNTYTFLLWSRFRRCKVWNLFRPLIHILPPSFLSIRRVMSNATCLPLRQMIPRQRRILSSTRLSRAVVDDMQRRINRNAPFIDSQATLSCSAQTHTNTTNSFLPVYLSLSILCLVVCFSLCKQKWEKRSLVNDGEGRWPPESKRTRARAPFRIEKPKKLGGTSSFSFCHPFCSNTSYF